MDQQQQWQSGRQPAPEILPPGSMPAEQGYGYQQQPLAPPPRSQRPAWRLAPATYVLMGINIAVYLLMLMGHVYPHAPTSDQYVDWGANIGVYVLQGHQWWRLVTATFIHSGIIHLATNMWCLYNLGLLGEPLLGTFGVFAAYLLTGMTGNLLGVAMRPGSVIAGHIVDPGVVSVGASGAVFGLAGVLILLLGSKLLPVARVEVQRLRRSVIYFAVLNFVIGFGANAINSPIRIDNMAHLGGFLSGLALGLVLVPKLGADRPLWVRRQWLAFGGMLLVVLLGARFVASLWHA